MTEAMRNYEAMYQQKESEPFVCYECQKEGEQSKTEVLSSGGQWYFICEKCASQECSEDCPVCGTYYKGEA